MMMAAGIPQPFVALAGQPSSQSAGNPRVTVTIGIEESNLARSADLMAQGSHLVPRQT